MGCLVLAIHPFSFFWPMMWNLARLALLAGLLLTACGGGSQQSTPEPISPGYARDAGTLVIQADAYGGLVRAAGRHVPEVSIYGDGSVILGQEDGARRVGTDRAAIVGQIGEEELLGLLEFIIGTGFFQLGDQYRTADAPTDTPCREVSVHLLTRSKTVAVCPFDEAQAPAAFSEVYVELTALSPSDAMVFSPDAGLLTATDLGPIDELGGGRGSQVAPWDTPLVGFALEQAAGGLHLEGQEYRRVEEFLLRYPPGQLFGSQEGRAYEVLLEADLPWQTEPDG